MKRTLKFTSKGARDNFLGEHKEGISIISDTEVEVVVAEMDKQSMDEKTIKMMDAMYRDIYAYMDYKDRQYKAELNYFYEMWENHRAGHLPNVKSAEQMKRAIDNLGLNEEYEVAKRTIFASMTDDGKGNLLVDFAQKK